MSSISYPLFSFVCFSWAGPPSSEVDSLWSATVRTVFHNEWRVSAFLVCGRHSAHMLLRHSMSQWDSKSYEALFGVGQEWVQFIPAIIWREWDNVSWLHNSVGKASHRYRGGHGFESRWMFLGFLCNCLSGFTTEKITFTCILYPQLCIYMIYIIYTWSQLALRNKSKVESCKSNEERRKNHYIYLFYLFIYIFFTVFPQLELWCCSLRNLYNR